MHNEAKQEIGKHPVPLLEFRLHPVIYKYILVLGEIIEFVTLERATFIYWLWEKKRSQVVRSFYLVGIFFSYFCVVCNFFLFVYIKA